MKQLVFIINTKAGNGASMSVWNTLKESLEQKAIRYHAHFTKYPKHAEQLAKQICDSNDGDIEAVVAVGGDGTVHEVVNGMVNNPKIKIGYIPAGSGNDFSRGFSIPKNPMDALDLILNSKENKPTLFDIGKFEVEGKKDEHYFVSSLGAGFDAAVAMQTNQSQLKKLFNKVRLGSLAYVGVLIRLLFTYKRTNITLTIDERVYTYKNVWFVTVSNQPYYGGGMKIAPSASTTDGILDITVAHNLSRIKLLLVFGSVFFAKHTKFKEVQQHLGSKISIESDSKMFVHADGELMGNTPVKACVSDKKMMYITEK